LSVLRAVVEGLRAVRRRPSLVALLLAVNLLVAALLAVPLVGVLQKDLANTDAAGGMLYGFDYAWWTVWHTGRAGWTASFGPDILGSGFAFKNLELLLRGSLPAGRFESPEDAKNDFPVDGVVLGLGVLYLLVQAFLSGGVLGALRGGQGSPPPRGLLHGSAFYFGRILRVTGLVLVLDAALFSLNGPFARWAEERARESVSEATALSWLFGRHLLLLLGLLALSTLSSYAKVILVLEERRSALLALVSALGFGLRHLGRVVGHVLAMALLGVLCLAAWSALDSSFETTGYKTQLVSMLLSQALVGSLIGLRVALYAGQIGLYRALPKGP